jgi:hypothetical protein
VVDLGHDRECNTDTPRGYELGEAVSLPGNADTDLRDWDPGDPAVKENGCSCIFRAVTTAVYAD